MTRDDRLVNLLTDWLEEQATSAPDQLLDYVLTDLRTAPQRAHWRAALRRLLMSGSNALRLAAVAVVALIAVIGVAVWAGGGNGIGGPVVSPTPSATVPPTLAPTPSEAAASANPLPPAGQLDAGTYLYPEGRFAPAAFTFSVPGGWFVRGDGWQVAKYPDTSRQLGFASFVVRHIFSDACTRGVFEQIEVGPTADDLASALMEQSGPIAEGPYDVTVGGYPGKRVDLTPTAELENCRLFGDLQLWLDQAGNYGTLLGDGRASVYIVDVDGARLVLVRDYRASSSATDIAELEAIIQSIRIKP